MRRCGCERQASRRRVRGVSMHPQRRRGVRRSRGWSGPRARAARFLSSSNGWSPWIEPASGDDGEGAVEVSRAEPSPRGHTRRYDDCQIATTREAHQRGGMQFVRLHRSTSRKSNGFSCSAQHSQPRPASASASRHQHLPSEPELFMWQRTAPTTRAQLVTTARSSVPMSGQSRSVKGLLP